MFRSVKTTSTTFPFEDRRPNQTLLLKSGDDAEVSATFAVAGCRQSDDHEFLDATTLGRRLGFKRDIGLAYLSRRNFRRIPRPNRQLAMGPIWYEKSVREWEAMEEGRARGK
jgi:hypothetical protein